MAFFRILFIPFIIYHYILKRFLLLCLMKIIGVFLLFSIPFCSGFNLFQDFVDYYAKTYVSDLEYREREIIFNKNKEFIENHYGSHSLSLNEFSDMTPYEFHNTMKGFQSKIQGCQFQIPGF